MAARRAHEQEQWDHDANWWTDYHAQHGVQPLPVAATEVKAQWLARIVDWTRPRVWLIYTLTGPHGLTLQRLEQAHGAWRAECEAWLRRPLPEYRVTETRADGSPHFHGVLALPHPLPPGFAQAGVDHWITPQMQDAWQRHARVPRRGEHHASKIERLRNPIAGVRYCVKHLKHERADDAFFGEWSAFSAVSADDVQNSTVCTRPGRVGRPPSARVRALEKIRWLKTHRITASREINAHLASWVKQGLFSVRTFEAAKKKRGIRSVASFVPHDRFRPYRYEWQWDSQAAAHTEDAVDYGHEWSSRGE